MNTVCRLLILLIEFQSFSLKKKIAQFVQMNYRQLKLIMPTTCLNFFYFNDVIFFSLCLYQNTNKCSEVYSGTSAESERETQAVMTYFRSVEPACTLSSIMINMQYLAYK